MRIPAETKSLLLVTLQCYLGVDLAIRVDAVLGAVKHQDLAINSQRGNEVWVLGAVAGLVDLAIVVDLLDNVPLDCSLLCLAVASNFASLLIVVARVYLDGLGDLNLGDLKIVRLAFGGVGTNQSSMDAAVLSLGFLDVGEPLDRQGRPS